jgi:ubiquinone/menaquinone biosynthesis C-methylase UbiE
MVGEQGGRGRDSARLSGDELGAGMRAAYDASAADWAAGPERTYGRLATALVEVAAAAEPLAGHVVLDLGAGTGVAGRAALAAGARQVICADLAVGMLRHCGGTLHPVAADATALPFRDGAVDLVLAAFSLSHLPSIAAGLAEIRRVGRAVAASSFSPQWTHPAKTATDEALRAFGYVPPAWYASLKDDGEPQAADAALMADLAAAAGFRDVRCREVTVPTGLSTPAELASWRLGMAHVVPFVRVLDPRRQAELRRAAERSVAATGCGPLTVSMGVLTAR